MPSVPLPSVEPPSPTPAIPTAPATSVGSGGVQTPSLPGYGAAAGNRVGAAVAVVPSAGSDWAASSSRGSGAEDSRAQRRAARRQRRARERAFRRKVRRLSPCFYALSEFESDILAQRAGLRGSRPRSRVYVARKLEISTRRVHRSERRGLRKLRRADASDRCGFGSARGPKGVDVAESMLAGTPLAVAVAFLVSGESSDHDEVGSPRRADRGEVAGVETSSDPEQAGIALPLGGSGDGEYGSGGVPIAALLAAAALLLTAAILATQGRRHPAAAAAGAPSTAARTRAERRAVRARTRARRALNGGRATQESIADAALPPPPWEQPEQVREEQPQPKQTPQQPAPQEQTRDPASAQPDPAGSAADHGRPRKHGSIGTRNRR